MHTYLAAAYEDADPLWIYQLVGLASLAALIVVPIFVFRALRRSRAGIDPAGIFSGIADVHAPNSVAPGEVRIKFTTYSGFLVFVTQRRYDVSLPAEQARVVLGRMIKHNCTSGMFAYGCLFIPLLSFLEYRSQMKKVNEVLQRGFPIRPR